MNRLIYFCLLTVLTLGFGSLLLQAMPIPKKKPIPNVEGLTWVSDEQSVDLGIIEYTFSKDGILDYKYIKNGSTYTGGSWKQSGEDLYWECNNKYVEYNLKFKDGNFVGSAKNIVGLKWDVTLLPKSKQ
jgi:hypothetical protein